MNRQLLELLSPITGEEQRLLNGEALDKALYTTKGGFIVDRAQLLAGGRLLDIRPHTRFAAFPAHSHNYVEIIYMCAGGTTHTINGKTTLALQPGELLMLNQHASHAIATAGAGDIAVNFLVLPEFLDYALELIGPDNLLGRFLVGSLQQRSGESSYLHFRVAKVLPVQNLVENLIWSLVHQGRQSRRLNQVTMGLLFLQLMEHTGQLETEAPASHALVVGTLREIEENCTAASLTRLAAQYKVSVAYLSHIVHKATGRTFKALLQEKRLTKAAGLLAGTTLTVGEVILAAGYDNQSYFYRIFRRRYGVAPSAYRAANRREAEGAAPAATTG